MQPISGILLPSRDAVAACTACPLHKGTLTPVLGEGADDAPIMLLGEAPGYHEDRQGRPFVGPAGKVLNYILSDLGVSRRSVYITNTVKHRPAKNRKPLPEELAACRPYLDQEIAAVRPRLIVCLGASAAAVFFPRDAKARNLRVLPDGTIVAATYHPAFFLHARRPAIRQAILEDIQQGMSLIGLVTDDL